MKIRPLETHTKMLEIETRLSKHQYLSKEALPGTADACVFQKLQASQRKREKYAGIPTKDKYENFYHWYIMMGQFAPSTIKQWIHDDDTLENDKLIVQIINFLESLDIKQNENNRPQLEYLISIKVKESDENRVKIIKKKLQEYFQQFHEKVCEYVENASELRLTLNLASEEFEKLKDIVWRWEEVDSIQVKKIMRKQTKP